MITMETWATYLGGLSAFAGVVFAVMLAARAISDKTRDHRNYLLWDSLAVTYELAAAALLGSAGGRPHLGLCVRPVRRRDEGTPLVPLVELSELPRLG